MFTLHRLRLKSLLAISVQDRSPSPYPSLSPSMLMTHKGEKVSLKLITQWSHTQNSDNVLWNVLFLIQEGRLQHEDLGSIWNSYAENLHSWLLRLTEEFDLTFPLHDEEVNLVPCLLPEKQPEVSTHTHTNNSICHTHANTHIHMRTHCVDCKRRVLEFFEEKKCHNCLCNGFWNSFRLTLIVLF